MSAPALLVENVSFAYSKGSRALDRVSFCAPQGCFTALLGPNGAGKTTLLGLITRLFAGEGRIVVCGFDLYREPLAALASMGVVFQRPTLDLDLSVERNLAYAAGLYGLDRARTQARIEAVLAQLNLTDRRQAKVRTLSGGLRRRVELARALLHEPRLLVLDEPTVGLDIESRRALVEHVHALCREQGIAALWATHLVDEVWPEDHLVVLHRGKVVAEGPLRAVLARLGEPDLARAFGRVTRDLPVGERVA